MILWFIVAIATTNLSSLEQVDNYQYKFNEFASKFVNKTVTFNVNHIK